MFENVDIGETTRRAVMKAAAAALGSAVVSGAASGHPTVGLGARRFEGNEPVEIENTALESYHSLGATGPESVSGDASEPHYGGLFEFRPADDIAVISVFSSREPTPQRGLAVLDVSDFARATSKADLDNSSITVLSFVRNQNGGAAWMDAKISQDGNYAFISQQPLTAAFGEIDDGVNTDAEGADPDAKGTLVVNLTDPGNPEIVAKAEGQSPTGPHNSWHHQIDGREYVFNDAGDVFEFDRGSETLEPVSFWDYSGHDLVIQDDPKYGIPILYLSDWNGGLRLFDVSDPTVDDITQHELGVFEMDRAHYSVPTPTLMNGTRFAVAGQENPSDDDGVNAPNGGQSGFLYLIDCDPIDDVMEGNEDGPVNLGTASDTVPNDERDQTKLEEDRWILFENASVDFGDVDGFQHEQNRVEDPNDDFKQYDGFPDYNLSPHNFDINPDGTIAVGHYHAGTRFLEIDPEARTLEETGYYREFRDIPLDACVEELLRASPFHWCSVVRNGLALTGCINSGAHVISHDELDVGNDTVLDADVDLTIDSSAYTAGQTARLDVSVDADEPTQVRVRLPTEVNILAADSEYGEQTLGETPNGVDPHEQVVTFDGTHEDATFTLLVELPESTGSYRIGPVEYARPSVDSQFGGGNGVTNRLWRKEHGAIADANVVGLDI